MFKADHTVPVEIAILQQLSFWGPLCAMTTMGNWDCVGGPPRYSTIAKMIFDQLH